jgi:hypothetical protein
MFARAFWDCCLRPKPSAVCCCPSSPWNLELHSICLSSSQQMNRVSVKLRRPVILIWSSLGSPGLQAPHATVRPDETHTEPAHLSDQAILTHALRLFFSVTPQNFELDGEVGGILRVGKRRDQQGALDLTSQPSQVYLPLCWSMLMALPLDLLSALSRWERSE